MILLLLFYLLQQHCGVGISRRSNSNSNSLLPYRGPLQSLDSIELGLQAADLGITLMVGPSSILKGADERGLFVSVSEDVELSVLPSNSIICGYSAGVFQDRAEGDKCVGYAFTDCSNGVVFNKKVVSLEECLLSLREERGLSDAALSRAVLGHTVLLDGGHIAGITPDAEDFRDRYFVPHIVPDEQLGAMSFGKFANDLEAGGLGRDQGFKNILQLVWRLSWDEGRVCMVPTWPVLILAEDVVISNFDPMEVGVSYGNRYWRNAAAVGRTN